MRIHRLLLTYNYSNRIQIVKDFSMTKLSVALEVWSLYELTKPQMEKFESQFFTISSQQIFERTLDCNWDLNSLRRAIERELGVKDDGHASSPRSSQESQEFVPTANFVARSSHKKTNKPETSVKNVCSVQGTIHQQLAISSKIMMRKYQSSNRRKSASIVSENTKQQAKFSNISSTGIIRSFITRQVFATILNSHKLPQRETCYKFREHANQTTTLKRAVIPASLYPH